MISLVSTSLLMLEDCLFEKKKKWFVECEFCEDSMLDLTQQAAYSVFHCSMCESRLQVMVLRLLEFNHCSGVQVIPAQHQVKIECLDQTTWCHIRFFCLTSNCFDCSLNCTSALGKSFK